MNVNAQPCRVVAPISSESHVAVGKGPIDRARSRLARTDSRTGSTIYRTRAEWAAVTEVNRKLTDCHGALVGDCIAASDLDSSRGITPDSLGEGSAITTQGNDHIRHSLISFLGASQH